MDKKSINQNESIQGGLERFLDEELLDYGQHDIYTNDDSIVPNVEKVEKRASSESRSRSQAVNQNIDSGIYEKKNSYKEDAYEKIDYEEDDYEEIDYEEDDYEEDSYEEKYEESVSRVNHKKARKTDGESQSHRTSKRKETQIPSKSHTSLPNKAKTKKDKKSKISKNKKKSEKKSSKAKKVIIILLITLLAVVLWWYFMVGSAYKKMNHDKSENAALGPMKEDGVINVLLIGNDSRQNGDDGRSDAMILVSISNKTKTIHMTSLLRDMYVEIPGHDSNRLNAAYAYGGASLLCETIEKNLGIEVNRYAIVNFQAFAGLVDSVGGIELDVTNEEVQWINAYLNEYNLLEGRELTTDYLDTSLSGNIHLNGPQALAYSRNRYIGTDFGRTERQRKVLNAVVKKLPMTLATNSSKLTDELFPNLTTNLTQLECYQLSLDASKLLSYDVIQSVVPAEGTYSNATIRKMAVLEVDFEANKKMLRKEIYGED